MYTDNWKPDYIVGITRGGNVPAYYYFNMTSIRCEALKVSLRDDSCESESNAWMAEDAFNNKNILIVDDINDTGANIPIDSIQIGQRVACPMMINGLELLATMCDLQL